MYSHCLDCGRQLYTIRSQTRCTSCTSLPKQTSTKEVELLRAALSQLSWHAYACLGMRHFSESKLGPANYADLEAAIRDAKALLSEELPR